MAGKPLDNVWDEVSAQLFANQVLARRAFELAARHAEKNGESDPVASLLEFTRTHGITGDVAEDDGEKARVERATEILIRNLEGLLAARQSQTKG